MSEPDRAGPTDEGPATTAHGPRLRIGTLMTAVAAAAFIFAIALGSGGIFAAIASFIAARLAVGWRSRSRPADDAGLVVLGVNEREFGNAMVYAAFVLLSIALLKAWGGG